MTPPPDPSTGSWRALRADLGDRWAAARAEVHWAANVVAALGHARVAAASDSSHTNLGWDEPGRLLVGRLVDGPPRHAAALRCADLSLVLVDESHEPIEETPLDGLTLDGALAWLEGAAGRFAPGADAAPLALPAHELPPHPGGQGFRFSAADGEALAALEAWFADADRALAPVAARNGGAPPRLWPHHLDVGSLFTLDPDGDPALDASIGFGMTPGDDGYPEPYWYVNPYPRPDHGSTVPPLREGGRWHTAGWFGAVLRAAPVIEAGPAAAQERRVADFLASAVDACRGLLGG